MLNTDPAGNSGLYYPLAAAIINVNAAYLLKEMLNRIEFYENYGMTAELLERVKEFGWKKILPGMEVVGGMYEFLDSDNKKSYNTVTERAMSLLGDASRLQQIKNMGKKEIPPSNCAKELSGTPIKGKIAK